MLATGNNVLHYSYFIIASLGKGFCEKCFDMNESSIEILTTNDPVGPVYRYKEKIYRGIFEEHVACVKSLFENGIIERLEKDNLIPKTRLTEHRFGRYKMVLEHEVIWPVTYPMEWSFSMLKDAAAITIRVNSLLNEMGYELKDAHLYNVLFSGGSAVFVDIGSIQRLKYKNQWQGYDDFLQGTFYPLVLYARDDIFLVKSILHGTSRYGRMPYGSLLRVKYPFLNRFLSKRIEKLRRKFHTFSRYLFPYSNDRMLAKVLKLKQKRSRTKWKKYLNEQSFLLKNIDANPRFNRIVELIKEYDADTLLDIGGGSGLVSILASQYGGVKKVACMDSDHKAIECLYEVLKTHKLLITPIHHDFNSCEHTLCERVRSDIVLVLELSHHLILEQHCYISSMFKKLRTFTKKYLFIEFMPKGCSGKKLQDWYTLSWFKSSMEKYFNIIHEEKLGEGRVLLIGKV